MWPRTLHRTHVCSGYGHVVTRQGMWACGRAWATATDLCSPRRRATSRAQLVGYVHRASALGESGYDSNTTVQDTWFQLAISAHSPKHLEEGLEYLSQLPVSLRCSDEDVEDERHLYLQDWRSMQVCVCGCDRVIG